MSLVNYICRYNLMDSHTVSSKWSIKDEAIKCGVGEFRRNQSI